jgi:hypothetical protein
VHILDASNQGCLAPAVLSGSIVPAGAAKTVCCAN